MLRTQRKITRISPRLNQTTRRFEVVDNYGNELYSEPTSGKPAGYHKTIIERALEWAVMLDLPETAVQPFTLGEWTAPNRGA